MRSLCAVTLSAPRAESRKCIERQSLWPIPMRLLTARCLPSGAATPRVRLTVDACRQVSSQSSPGTNLHLSPSQSEEGVGPPAGSEADEAAKNMRKVHNALPLCSTHGLQTALVWSVAHLAGSCPWPST